MTLGKRFLGLLLLLALPLIAAAQIPDLGQSSAWMPWTDFKEIMRLIHKNAPLPTPDPPPADVVVSAVRYQGALQGESAAISAAFEISTLGDDWVAAPLIPASLAIADPLLDGRPALMNVDSGWHNVILFGPGKHTFTARFFVKTGNRLGPTSIAFDRLPAPVATIDFTVPLPGMDLKADPAAYNAVTNTDSSSRLEAALKPSETVIVSWSRKIEAAEAALRQNAEVETLARLGEKLCQVSSVVTYEILHQGVTSLAFELPPDVTVVDVTGAGVAEWRAAKEGDKQKVAVDLSFEARDKYALTVEYEKALADVNAEVMVPELAVLNVNRERGKLAVAARTSIEVDVLEMKGLISMDPSDLPDSLRSRSAEPILHAGSYTAHPFSLKLKTTRHDDLAGLPAAIDSMRLSSFLTQDGKVLTKMNLDIKNNRVQFLRLKLPGPARLLSVYIGDRPVRASLSADGHFLIPLDKAGSEAAASFSAEIIYLESLAKLKSWRGKLSLEAPQTNLIVNQMTWDLTLPEKYEYKVDEDKTSLKWNEPVEEPKPIFQHGVSYHGETSAEPPMFEPSLVPATAAGASVPIGYAHVDQSLATTPAAPAPPPQELDGKKADESKSYPSKPSIMPDKKIIWSYSAAEFISERVNQAVLPVRLDMPDSGIMPKLSFGKSILQEDEANTIVICYKKESRVSMKIIVVTAVLVIAAAFFIRRRIARKNRPGFAMGLFIIASMIALSAPAAAEGPKLPDLTGSYLSIPWPDMKALLELIPGDSVTTPVPSPPVDHVLSSASYEARVVKDAVEVKATMRLIILEKKKWVLAPVLSDQVAAAEILVDGAPGLVVTRDGFHQLVLKGAAEHTITARFYVASGENAGPKEVYLPLVMTPATYLSFTVPEAGLKIEAEPASMQKIEAGAGTTQLFANVPPTPSLRVSWMKKVEAREQELRQNADVETNIAVGEQLVSFSSVVHYEILHRGVTGMSLALPADVTVVNVTGQGVADWKAEKAEAVQNLAVTLSYEAKDRYDLTVLYENSLPDSTADLLVPVLQVKDVNRERGHLAVTAEQNLEVVVKAVSNLAGIDASELPPSLAGGAVVHAFKYVSPPWALGLQVTRHKDVAGLACAADQADLVSFLTKDGEMVTRALFTIRNNREQFIRLALPKDSRVFSALRNGRPVKPAKDKDGRVLIPLEKASDAAGLAKSFSIEIVYLTPIDKLKKRSGSIVLETPKANILTKAMNLWLHLPDEYEWEVKDTSLNYDKDRGIPGAPRGRAIDFISNESQAPTQMNIMSNVDRRAGAFVSGGLPVYFDVPTAGRTLFLNKSVLGEDEANAVELGYKKPCKAAETAWKWVKKAIGWTLVILLPILVLYLFYRIARRLFRKTPPPIPGGVS